MLSHVWFLEMQRTVARQAPKSMRFPREEYYIGLPFPSPGDFPDPGIESRSPALQADSLLSEPPGKTLLEDPVLLEVSILMNGTLVFEGTISNYSRNELTEERPVNDSYLDLESRENGGCCHLHCVSFSASPSSPCWQKGFLWPPGTCLSSTQVRLVLLPFLPPHCPLTLTQPWSQPTKLWKGHPTVEHCQ